MVACVGGQISDPLDYGSLREIKKVHSLISRDRIFERLKLKSVSRRSDDSSSFEIKREIREVVHSPEDCRENFSLSRIARERSFPLAGFSRALDVSIFGHESIRGSLKDTRRFGRQVERAYAFEYEGTWRNHLVL